MPRPRRDDDDVLLERIAAAIHARQERTPWTLAEIAGPAGLSPAGLVKRFGSRRDILRALSLTWITQIPTAVCTDDPRSELRRWILTHHPSAGAASMARGLGELMDDLADPGQCELLAQGWAAETRYVAALLEHLPLTRLAAPVAASVLLDAVRGAALRHAADPATPAPICVADNLLEEWT